MQTILAKYLTKNILVVFFAIFFIIAFLIIGNVFTGVLKSSLNQNLDISSVLSLVLIKSLRDIPLIITLSFFVAIIIAIGKLYKDSEIYAMNSTGIGEIKILQKITFVILFMASITFAISMFLVPYSNTVKDNILQKNANTSEFRFIQTKKFQEFDDGKIVLYAKGDNDGGLGNIFIYTKYDKNIVLAENGGRYQDGANNVYIRLKNGVKYDGFFQKDSKNIFEFETMDVKIFNKKTKNNKIKTKTNAKSLNSLLSDPNNVNISEIWWRISLPVSMIILSIIGVFLSKSPPRSSKNFSILYGIIIFAVYLNLLKIYKEKIAGGEDLFISMLLPHLIFLVIAIILYFKNNKFNHIFNFKK
jgi:lipopolysaccharide export system permease protein